MDVHKETISIAVMNSAGKLVMESILETKAMTILRFVQGMREKGAERRQTEWRNFSPMLGEPFKLPFTPVKLFRFTFGPPSAAARL
jgi:hypothetical protein